MPLDSSPKFESLLAGKKLPELRRIHDEVGRLVHRVLYKSGHGLMLQNGVAAGCDTDTMASNNGSSDYLRGGFVDYSGNIGETSQSLVDRAFHLCDEAEIPQCDLVAGSNGYASGDRAGELVVYAGKRNQLLETAFSCDVDETPGTPEHRQAIQQISSIIALHQVLGLVAAEVRDITNTSSVNTFEGVVINESLLSEAEKVEQLNLKIWTKLSSALNGQKLSIGESFTSGILARVITSIPGASQILDKSLNWYSPKLKQWVGVPERNVQEDMIAEPETIALATQGLLKKTSDTTQIALGTTGWANYWVEGKPDYFSIGISSEDGTETAYVQVTASKDAPRARGRRQLTRHLGATVALYMLAKHLGSTSLEQQLLETVRKYAEISIKKVD